MIPFGYIRVSTEEQGESGLGLDAQRAAIEAACRARGWDAPRFYPEVGSAATIERRPMLQNMLLLLDDMKCDRALVVAKVDRLSRSVVDFALLVERAKRAGWALVALDLGVDTTTPSGELVANIMAALAQWERRIIGERTKAAMAQASARGVHVGRPRSISPDLVAQMRRLREEQRCTFREIAAVLNGERLFPLGWLQPAPPPRGGKRWYASTVQRALAR